MSHPAKGRPAFRTGFHQLDRILEGIGETGTVLLCARPRMGKTAFALSVIRNLAVGEGKAVALFSLESSQRGIEVRFLAQEARIARDRLDSATQDEHERERVAAAADALASAPIFIDDRAEMGPPDMGTLIRGLKDQGEDVALAVVDYVQLIPGVVTVDDTRQAIQELGTIARELSVPIFVLAQLPHDVAERTDRRPLPSDATRFGADASLLLHRDDLFDEDGHKREIAEIVVLGPDGTVAGVCTLGVKSGNGRFVEVE